MKTIILARHSYPQKVKGISNKEIPLSSKGLMVAKKFFLNDIFYDVKYIYSSTYRIAYDTAKIFSNNVVKYERLIERVLGEVENLDDEFWENQYKNYDYKNINGESLNDVSKRMVECIMI